MSHQKIIIIGSGGSGKSTLAKALGKKLHRPVVHLDQLYWCGHWEHVSDKEFDDLLAKELVKEEWIIDGNFNRTIPMRLARCDTVIYLDYPRILSILGVIKRVLTHYGHTRPDMGGNCPERFDIAFLKWVWQFNSKNRAHYYSMLDQVEGKNIYILHSRRACRKFLDEL